MAPFVKTKGRRLLFLLAIFLLSRVAAVANEGHLVLLSIKRPCPWKVIWN